MKSVFVSSTFRDMHFERDVLNRRIGPRINHYLSQYNQSVRITDLRWGVDTSELSEADATARVLKVCFDEIEHCRPHIIILLGDRYGYIPDGESLSVTHMEILRGALESADREHVHIYFRKSDYAGMPEELGSVFVEQDPAVQKMLLELKALLLREFPTRCKEYTAVWSAERKQMVSESFAELVYEDLKAEFESEFSAMQYRSPLEKQLAENEALLHEHEKYAYKKTVMLEKEAERIVACDFPYAILGEAGAGKSVYFSLLCSHLRKSGKNAHVLFCGDNGFSASVRNAAEFVLRVLIGEEYDYQKYAAYSYEELLTAIGEQRDRSRQKAYILLDAIDKCEEGMLNFILWCRRYLPDQVQIVCSTRPLRSLTNVANSFKFRLIEYEKADYLAMAQRLLQQQGKKINDELLEQMVQHTTSPLQLRAMLLRLLNLNASDFEQINSQGGGIDAINAHLRKIIENTSSDLPGVIGALLQAFLGESPDPRFAVMLLGLIAFSDFGLPEDDLEKIMDQDGHRWVQLDYLDFLARFAFFLRTRDNGCVDISHDTVRTTLRDLLKGEQRRFLSMISAYYLSAEPLSAFGVRTFMTAAFKGNQSRNLIDFVVQKHEQLGDRSGQGMEFVMEFRKCIRQMFVTDKGAFLFASAGKCQSVKELLLLQAAITGALTTTREYVSEKTAVMMAQAVMRIPLQMSAYPADMAELDLFAVKKFLKRQNMEDASAEKFYALCQEKIDRRKPAVKEACKEEDAAEKLFESLTDPGTEDSHKLRCLLELSEELKRLAPDPKARERAERILLKLLELDISSFAGDAVWLYRADFYTILGNLYKAGKQWEKALYCDECSLKIHKEHYEANPHPEYFRKYRERVYNVANVMEAWAMHEKTNRELWKETSKRYAENYRLDMIAVGQGVDSEELLLCAGAIVSYGTALINTGSVHEGFAKYQEAIAIIVELSKKLSRPDPYVKLCTWLMECTYQLMRSENHIQALTISKELGVYVAYVAKCDDRRVQDELMRMAQPFTNHLNDSISEHMAKKDMKMTLLYSGLLCDFYEAFVPIAPFAHKANALLTMRNIGDIHFLHFKDHSAAFAAYDKLLCAMKTWELLCPDEQGKLHDEITLRLGEPLVRRLLCVEKLGQIEEQEALVEKTVADSIYLASHSVKFRDNPALLLYMLGMQLMKESKALALAVLANALQTVSDMPSDTALKITMSIRMLQEMQ